MIVLADSGSTKTHWALIKSSEIVDYKETQGVNPLHGDLPATGQAVAEGLVSWPLKDVLHIYFYGAGCASPKLCQQVAGMLTAVFPHAQAQVASDMLGAARAVHQHSPGVASILGTGSNSCWYDGKHIKEQVPALGYILGDEGSGAVLGRTVINRYFKRDMPPHLRDKFEAHYPHTLEDVLPNVYRSNAPSRYLAGFSRFIADNLTEPYLKTLAYEVFEEFFQKNIAQYPHAAERPLGFVGSVAWYYRPVIAEVAQNKGYTLGKILQAPVEELARYHTND